MQIKDLLWGLPVLFFIGWIFVAPTPQNRIERLCEPVNWAGNIATSTTALAKDERTATTARWSDKLNYSCKYMVWRLFYQDEYNKAVAAGLIPANTTAQSAQAGAVANAKPVHPDAQSKGKEAGKPADAAQPTPGEKK